MVKVMLNCTCMYVYLRVNLQTVKGSNLKQLLVQYMFILADWW